MSALLDFYPLPFSPLQPLSLWFPYGPVLVYIISHIPCPSPFAALMSTPGLCWLSSGCPTWVCQGLHPVNVTYTLLIFILFFLRSFGWFNINCLTEKCVSLKLKWKVSLNKREIATCLSSTVKADLHSNTFSKKSISAFIHFIISNFIYLHMSSNKKINHYTVFGSQ
jgi:hypothetical protein